MQTTQGKQTRLAKRHAETERQALAAHSAATAIESAYLSRPSLLNLISNTRTTPKDELCAFGLSKLFSEGTKADTTTSYLAYLPRARSGKWGHKLSV